MSLVRACIRKHETWLCSFFALQFAVGLYTGEPFAVLQNLTLSLLGERVLVQLKLCLLSTSEYQGLKADSWASKRNIHKKQILEKKKALSSLCCSFFCKMKVTLTFFCQAALDIVINSDI